MPKTLPSGIAQHLPAGIAHALHHAVGGGDGNDVVVCAVSRPNRRFSNSCKGFVIRVKITAISGMAAA